ncbi:hypothetical protein ACFWBN_20580 [Streptomyces sp. NPDC059989]|uniref:hypothetical protein n=1 Tax=Streptomyces sp. NPDC059989 TaxID=3347026 RepID=UPI0036A5D606
MNTSARAEIRNAGCVAAHPAFDLLVAMDKPNSGLAWSALRHDQPGNASQRLRQLALGQIPLTHDAFHELQPWRSAAHLEALLMASGVLRDGGAVT